MKRFVSILLAAVLILSLGQTVTFAASSTRDTSFEESLAYDLKALGLFEGVSNTDFDLDRAPTRTEAIVMLIRMLGKEDEALGGSWSHPFTDVASWADKYIGYAYENGLVNGISDTQFGSDSVATANMYLTFVLRSLGYSDTDNKDFSWTNPFSLANSAGILPVGVDTADFWRADVVLVSYAALKADLKDTTETLSDKLIADGVFSEGAFFAYYDASALGSGADDQETKDGKSLTASEIYSKCSSAVFYIEVYDASGNATASGSGFFIDSNGTAVTNYHVIEGCSSAKITTSDTEETYDVAGVYNYNIDQDWAVIKVNGSDFSYLTISDKGTVSGGQTVYAIGSPLGLQSTISEGLISNPSRELDGINFIQTSAPISPGSSGGALINTYGEVIGITCASYLYGQNINLAIPISYVNRSISGNYTPMSAFLETAAAADPTAYLKYFLMDYGTYYEGYSAYSLEMQVVNEYVSINYYAADDILSLEYAYYNSNSGYYAQINLDPPESTDASKYPFEFSQYSIDDSSAISASGQINPSTFSRDSRISFEEYTGDTEMETSCKTAAVNLMMNLLNYTQYMFDYCGMPISIKNFGFSKAYSDYMER